MINIYVGSYAGYNAGILDGSWHNLPNDNIWEDIKKSCVCGVEEFGIFDYEAEFKINEHDSIDYLNEISKQLETMTEEERLILNALIDDGYGLEEALNTIDDCIYHPYDNFGDIAYYYYVDCGLIDDENPLFRYVDWDRMGRDMSFEGNFLEAANGHIVEVLR